MKIQNGKKKNCEERDSDYWIFENQRFRGNSDSVEIARVGGGRGDYKSFEENVSMFGGEKKREKRN